MAENTGGRQLQSVNRTYEILQFLSSNGQSKLRNIADHLGITPGTAHTYLSTLQANGFVHQVDQQYRLGLNLIPLGESARNQVTLYEAGEEPANQLAQKYNAVAHLTTEYDQRLLILCETFGEDAIGKEVHMSKWDSPQTHLHCTAAGKAMLAHFPESKVNSIIDEQELPELTSHTITDREVLQEELINIQDRGYALNNQETIKGNKGVGAPVFRDDGTLEGAISISGPANSWADDRFTKKLPNAVMRAASTIEINIHSKSY